MFFHHKHKIAFGTDDEDLSIFAEKIQAIAYVSWGWFEGDILDVNHKEKDPVVWRLSDHIYSSDVVGFSTEKKLKAAKDKLQRRKDDKAKILEEIALKNKTDDNEMQ